MKYVIIFFALIGICLAGIYISPNKQTGEFGRICSKPLPPPEKSQCQETTFKK
uniref:Uncharacterized protein n=1 Tax=Megaselia scalaris TaxID=36166 RepID=T1GQZ1_MEGSC